MTVCSTHIFCLRNDSECLVHIRYYKTHHWSINSIQNAMFQQLLFQCFVVPYNVFLIPELRRALSEKHDVHTLHKPMKYHHKTLWALWQWKEARKGSNELLSVHTIFNSSMWDKPSQQKEQ